jgi:hypothetical protein
MMSGVTVKYEIAVRVMEFVGSSMGVLALVVGYIVLFDMSILSINWVRVLTASISVLGMFPPSPTLTTLTIIKNITNHNRRTGKNSPASHSDSPNVSETSGITLIFPTSAPSMNSGETRVDNVRNRNGLIGLFDADVAEEVEDEPSELVTIISVGNWIWMREQVSLE